MKWTSQDRCHGISQAMQCQPCCPRPTACSYLKDCLPPMPGQRGLQQGIFSSRFGLEAPPQKGQGRPSPATSFFFCFPPPFPPDLHGGGTHSLVGANLAAVGGHRFAQASHRQQDQQQAETAMPSGADSSWCAASATHRPPCQGRHHKPSAERNSHASGYDLPVSRFERLDDRRMDQSLCK